MVIDSLEDIDRFSSSEPDVIDDVEDSEEIVDDIDLSDLYFTAPDDDGDHHDYDGSAGDDRDESDADNVTVSLPGNRKRKLASVDYNAPPRLIRSSESDPTAAQSGTSTLTPLQVEQIRQVRILLDHVPEAAFVWTTELIEKNRVPAVIEAMFASPLPVGQVKELLTTRVQQFRQVQQADAKLLLERLRPDVHVWPMQFQQSLNALREKSLWFNMIRKRARDHVGAAQYEALGLAAMEKQLKQLQKTARHSMAKQEDAKRQRLDYDHHYNALEEETDIYPTSEHNMNAMRAALTFLGRQNISGGMTQADTDVRVAVAIKFGIYVLDSEESRYLSPAARHIIDSVSNVQCIRRMQEMLCRYMGQADYAQWWCTKSHRFYSNQVREYVDHGLPGLVQLFISETRNTIKVTAESGACYIWNEETALWQSSGPSQLDSMFLAMASKALGQGEANLHMEYLNSRVKCGEEDVNKDQMLAVMLENVRKLTRKIAEGTISSTFRKAIVSSLMDADFRSRVNCESPRLYPIRDGWIIDLQSGEMRKRTSDDLFSFETKVMYRPGLNEYRSVIRFFVPICGGEVEGQYRIGVGDIADLETAIQQAREQANTRCESCEAQQDQCEECPWKVRYRALQMLHSLQIHLGYCLTGECKERAYMQHWGKKSSGKSTLWAIMDQIMGRFIAWVRPELITAMKHQRSAHDHTAAFLDLIGRRVLLAAELAPGTKMNEELIKLLSSGGEDKLTMRGCGATEMRSEKLNGKLIFVTNHLVHFSKHFDAATIDRDVVWKYQKQFDHESDEAKTMKTLIRAPEFLDEVFSWLVEGAKQWYVRGSTPHCDISKEATNEHKDEQSPLDAFLRARCDLPPKDASAEQRKTYMVSKAVLRHQCHEWYKKQREEEHKYEDGDPNFPKLHELKRLMEARDFVEKKRNCIDPNNPSAPATAQCVFMGLRLKSEEDQVHQLQQPRLIEHLDN